MAIRITDTCINCAACEYECPNFAIYEGGFDWKMSDGTGLKGTLVTKSGCTIDAEAPQKPFSTEFYYVVADKCTECIGFYEQPQCIVVCPLDSCIPDENHIETEEELLSKKEFLHIG